MRWFLVTQAHPANVITFPIQGYLRWRRVRYCQYSWLVCFCRRGAVVVAATASAVIFIIGQIIKLP
jgi:hypothetical protein